MNVFEDTKVFLSLPPAHKLVVACIKWVLTHIRFMNVRALTLAKQMIITCNASTKKDNTSCASRVCILKCRVSCKSFLWHSARKRRAKSFRTATSIFWLLYVHIYVQVKGGTFWAVGAVHFLFCIWFDCVICSSLCLYERQTSKADKGSLWEYALFRWQGVLLQASQESWYYFVSN